MPEVAVVMPKMSMTMTDGEVLLWTKKTGDSVGAGDVVCEVMTDKVDMEVESPVAGTLVRVVAAVGDQIQVGEPLAFIDSAASGLLDGLFGTASPSPTADSAVGGAKDVVQPEQTSQLTTPPSRKARIPALPGARRKAGEVGVDLARITGSGPGGAITIEDVESARAPQQDPETSQAPVGQPSPDPAKRTDTAPTETAVRPTAAPSRTELRSEPVEEHADPAFAGALQSRRTALRKAVARAMRASAEIPQFTVWAEIDLTEAARRRERISWTTVLLAAFGRALAAHPLPGAATDLSGGVCVAMAVDTPVGLLGPVLRSADSKSLTDLDSEVRTVAGRARSGRLSADELAGATTTFSNLGGWGIDEFNALLTPGQASALSVGAVRDRAVVRGGGLLIAPTCRVGLTVDHCQADGADAARVLEELTLLLTRNVATLMSP
jgi:pyruvate dehydrogenase E2 component (dihydrolipoamide acetyltransferase)